MKRKIMPIGVVISGADPLGEGDVGIKKFIDKLRKIGYTGHLTIDKGDTWRIF